jgi:hypothetical protein
MIDVSVEFTSESFDDLLRLSRGCGSWCEANKIFTYPPVAIGPTKVYPVKVDSVEATLYVNYLMLYFNIKCKLDLYKSELVVKEGFLMS